jgi:hypothetical protein
MRRPVAIACARVPAEAAKLRAWSPRCSARPASASASVQFGRPDESTDDFFAPLHAGHLRDELPEVLAFLALPPGWRFLLAPGPEDVWYDETLLDVGRSGD